MKFLADENIDQQIIARLRRDGHDVLAVVELAPSISDEIVLAEASRHGDLLLTADKDFGELVYRRHQLTTGVVLIRLAGLSSEAKAEIVAAVVRDHGVELSRAFAVISPGLVRIRPSP